MRYNKLIDIITNLLYYKLNLGCESLVWLKMINHHYQHQSVVPKGRTFTANQGTKVAVLSKDMCSTVNSGTMVAVLLGINRWVASYCFPHPILSLFSIWRDLWRSEKIPGAPTRRRGEWIWLTGPSGLHRNSPQGLNICSIRVFDQTRDPEIPITLRPLLMYSLFFHWNSCVLLHRFCVGRYGNVHSRDHYERF